MRLGLFFGGAKRNENYVLEDPRPVPRYKDDIHTGNAGLDGYTRLSIADPDRMGSPPSVKGTVGPYHLGPDHSFEQ